MLLSDRVQMVIGYFWHRVPSLAYTEIFAEDQLAYCGREHPLFARARRIRVAEAFEHDWAWRSYPLPEAGAVADNMEAVAMLVLSGRHLGYLPEHFAAPYVKEGLLAPLNPKAMRYRVAFQMVTRAERASGARVAKREIVEAFIEDM